MKTAFANGMQAMMSAGTPSTGQQHRMLSLRKTTLSRSSLSQPELTTLEQTGRVALAKYFTTQEMSDAQKSLMGMLAMDRDPNQINQGAGVSKIRYQDVTVRGDNANIGADVTAWAKSLVRQSPQGSWLATAPVSTMHFTATLVRQPSGQWQISSLFGAFAPGEGP
ncbi:hypothetical protein [Nostocoides japonicum]|uniref:hypothetical protein n=1 Tax=Nostocoides japonicum TaxID=99481 RepID=UPI0012FBA44F|nr:hypothetical protein [Tetrasphaera japonica]